MLQGLLLQSGQVDAFQRGVLRGDGSKGAPQLPLALEPQGQGLEQLEAGQIAFAAPSDFDRPAWWASQAPAFLIGLSA